MAILLLLMLLLHYGEGKYWPNFRRWCTRYAAPHVLLVFGAGTDVCAVARRGLCLVLWDEYVTTTCSRSTAALFLPSQVLDTTHPVLAPPLHFLTLAAPLQEVSFGDDATLSRSVRPSTRSRRGRRGPGQFPRSASPDATRRFPAGEESDDVESPEGKAPGAGTSGGS